MITKQDLLEAIAECQGTRSPNANTAIKLAAFYTILDHLDNSGESSSSSSSSSHGPEADQNSFSGYSFAAPDVVQFSGQSEFAKTINGKDQKDVWPVIYELMSLIQSMNERLYNGVMRKLQ